MSKPSSTKKSNKTLAEQADRHWLYQQSVQCPEAEIDFVEEQFKTLRGRKAKVLREDFCGTAYTACEWIKRRKSNRAYGVDLDGEVLNWGREHNVKALSKEQQGRISLMQADVLEAVTPEVDAVLAMNFSYWILMTRQRVTEYFKRIHQVLGEDGIFFLDCYGGYEAPKVLKEKRKLDGFTYIWHQADFDPLTNKMLCHIHFKFPDESKIKKAFSYEWRLWSLPEVREMLDEAGFKKVTIHWETADEDTGEGNGEFEIVERGHADPGWVTYIVAEK
jgi:cyclopropane fatty-acyl-phospholipid synthase-like methyltransferase